MELMRGKPVTGTIDSEISECFVRNRAVLSVYLIGGETSSRIYARSKVRKGEKLGADVILRDMPKDVERGVLVESLSEDAGDDGVTGIMIERPLPVHLSMDDLMGVIPPEKDVEGLHPCNYGMMAMGNPRFIPPTPLGALLMLNHYNVDIEGKSVAVIGRSPNVGRPLSILLSQKNNWGNATVTQVHSRSRDLADITLRSDVIIAAAGRKGLIKGDMVNDGTVIIDLGVNPEKDSIVGDVDIKTMETRDIQVTPTPGGTGPVTVSAMFINLALAGNIQREEKPDFDGMVRKIYGSNHLRKG